MSNEEFSGLKRMELEHFMGELGIVTSFGETCTIYMRDAMKRLSDDQLSEITDLLLEAFRIWSPPIVIDFTTQPPGGAPPVSPTVPD